LEVTVFFFVIFFGVAVVVTGAFFDVVFAAGRFPTGFRLVPGEPAVLESVLVAMVVNRGIFHDWLVALSMTRWHAS
jgi:hypothetical protein